MNVFCYMRVKNFLEMNFCHNQKTRILYSWQALYVTRRYPVLIEVPSTQEHRMKEMKSDLMHIQAPFRQLSLLSETYQVLLTRNTCFWEQRMNYVFICDFENTNSKMDENIHFHIFVRKLVNSIGALGAITQRIMHSA